jgi:hypothetical protein
VVIFNTQKHTMAMSQFGASFVSENELLFKSRNSDFFSRTSFRTKKLAPNEAAVVGAGAEKSAAAAQQEA